MQQQTYIFRYEYQGEWYTFEIQASTETEARFAMPTIGNAREDATLIGVSDKKPFSFRQPHWYTRLFQWITRRTYS